MLRLRPLAAVRPQPTQAARVASPPYDVLSTEEARALARGNPLSFLHVVKPEIDLPAGTDPHDDSVYAKGRENLDRLIDAGTLFRDEEPRIYLYRLVRNHRPQIGVVGCCHVDDYLGNVIRKHEHTRPDKEEDRTRHMLALNANTGPVFLTYRGRRDIAAAIVEDTNRQPLYHFDSPDNVTHTVWSAVDPSVYVDAFARVPCAYVADGHHRSASAARAAEVWRNARTDHGGDEAYNWFLCALFAADELEILPYNRVVRDLGGQSTGEILHALGSVGRLEPTTDPRPDRPGVFCLYLDGGWHRLEIDPATVDASDPIGSLDVSLLHDRVLAPIFGIGDERTDDRIAFVGGIRGTSALEEPVDDGRAAAAVSLHPTSIDELLTVADEGLIMPPKSTWFEPKLRSGLFIHQLEA